MPTDRQEVAGDAEAGDTLMVAPARWVPTVP